MSKLFQIEESDLAELESTLPKLVDRMFDRMDGRTRTQARRVQKILSNVRWGYGPPQNVTIIPIDDNQEDL